MAFLKNVLTSLFAYDPEGREPRIVELEQPIAIIGMGMETDTKRASRDVSRLAKRFEKYKRANGVPNKKQPWGFAAVSWGFDEKTRAFFYLMGDVVVSLEEVPVGLTGFEIPVGTYAVFPVRPKNRFGWGVAIVKVKQYAYTVWMPSSEYEPAGTIDDFEYHDERSTRKRKPEIDLYVAIRRRC
jgi:predicted transcriptional regulator YdeE